MEQLRGSMVKTATSQNGDKPKRLQVQSKHINLLSSTMDLFSELLTNQLIQLCSFLQCSGYHLVWGRAARRYDSIRYTQYRLRNDTDPIIVRSLLCTWLKSGPIKTETEPEPRFYF